MIKTETLGSFPAGNPFHHDLFRMGQEVGSNVMVMFEKHTHEEQPYIIVVNTKTGERLKLTFEEEV